MPSGATPEQVAFYVDLLKKVRATPDWKRFIEDGAFNDTFMVGDQYKAWLQTAEQQHMELMKEAGFLAKKQ